MALIVKCNLGTRFCSQNEKVALKRNGDLVAVWASDLKLGDIILWESERLVARKKKMFLEELGRIDPALRKWVRIYETTGAYYTEFEHVYDALSEAMDDEDLLYELSKGMKRKHANARSMETLSSWLSSENAPWLPLKQKDLVRLSAVLKSLTRQYRVGGVKREISRINKMGHDLKLRNLVGRIRGRRRKFGRSIGPRGRSRSKGIQKVGTNTKRQGNQQRLSIDSTLLFNEAERRSLRKYEAWVKELPSEEKQQWAIVKALPKSVGIEKKTQKPKKGSVRGFPSFRDGPLFIKNDRQFKQLKRNLGYGTAPELQREWPAMVNVDFAGVCVPPASFRFAVKSPSRIDSAEGDEHVHLKITEQTQDEVKGTLTANQSGKITVVMRKGKGTWTKAFNVEVKPLTEWNKLDDDSVELRVDLSEAHHWLVPSSPSFELIDERTDTLKEGVSHCLRVIPLQRPVLFPESYLQCLESRYIVPPFEWSPTFELPRELDLPDIDSIGSGIKHILHAYYLSRIGLWRRKTGEALENSLRGLELVRRLNPHALDDAVWKGIDGIKAKMGSSLNANLIITEWLFLKLRQALKNIQREGSSG